MKRLYYPAFSALYKICSVAWEDKESEFFKYFKTIAKKDNHASVVFSLTCLGSDTLNKSNAQKYHGFSQFKDPDLYVLKSRAHRFFLVYDKIWKNGRCVNTIVIICCLRKQSDSYTKKELNMIDAARMKYWDNRTQCADEESKEEF